MTTTEPPTDTTHQHRYCMTYFPGIVPGKPWAVRDHALGRAAQTNGLTGPLAYFPTENEARTWTAHMNEQHTAGTAPPYEVEEYRGDNATGYARHMAANESTGVGDVKFIRPA